MPQTSEDNTKYIRVKEDDLLKWYCDINNMFANTGMNFFGKPKEADMECIIKRAMLVKAEIGRVVNHNLLTGDFIPVNITPVVIKKILAKARDLA